MGAQAILSVPHALYMCSVVSDIHCDFATWNIICTLHTRPSFSCCLSPCIPFGFVQCGCEGQNGWKIYWHGIGVRGVFVWVRYIAEQFKILSEILSSTEIILMCCRALCIYFGGFHHWPFYEIHFYWPRKMVNWKNV